jgi:PAS domain S-box-containing protein
LLGAISPLAAAERPVATAIGDAFIDTKGKGTPDRVGQMATISGVLLSDPVTVSSGFALADLQDASGGATLFTTDRDLLVGRVQRGDVVVARGIISTYAGNRELNLTDVGRSGRAPLPPPKDVRISDLAGNKYEGELIRLTGILKAGPGISRHDMLLRDSTGEIPVQVSVQLFSDKEFADHCVRGGPVTVVGICNRFGSNSRYRILPRDEADFLFPPLPPYRLIALVGAGLGLVGLAALRVLRRRYRERREQVQREEARVALRALNDDLERRVAERTAEVREALATLDAAQDGAFIFDPDSFRFTYVNEGAVRTLGYPRAELLTMTALDIETKYDEPGFRALLAPMLRGDRNSLQITTFHRHRDGHQIPVEVNLQYIAPTGERPRYVSIVRDITERRRTEALIRHSQRLDAVGTLAGGIAHDINNALTPILMGLGVLRAKYPGDTALINALELSGRRGADMVRRLLSFAKPSEGHPTEISAIRLLEEVQQFAEYSFPKNLQIEIKCGSDDPRVCVDPTQLHQVLMNLCVNARDAMPGGGTITLEATTVEVEGAREAPMAEAEPGPYVVLRVSDTGVGMNRETAEHIFDPFFTTKSPDKGTGLGLSIASAIVKEHGGFIRMETELGLGSTFSVYLPAVTDRDAVEEEPVPPAAQFRGQGEKILVVDDEPAIRTVAELVLRRLQFEPVVATDGKDGLAQAARHRSTLRAVIVDLHMPVLSGLEFIRAFRQDDPEPLVVVISGRLEDEEREACSRLGVVAFIEKPFTEDQLAGKLEVVFARVPAG